MNLKFEDEKRQENIVSFKLTGELDHYFAPSVRTYLAELVADKYKNFIIDLNNVTFIDSTGLGVIANTAKYIKEENGYIILVTDKPKIIDLIETSGIIDPKQKHIALAKSSNEAEKFLYDLNKD